MVDSSLYAATASATLKTVIAITIRKATSPTIPITRNSTTSIVINIIIYQHQQYQHQHQHQNQNQHPHRQHQYYLISLIETEPSKSNTELDECDPSCSNSDSGAEFND
ncbi:hypothetical protein ACTFIU_000391 [Dictyostelium citrinum]